MTRFDKAPANNETNNHELKFKSVKLMGHEFLTGGENHFNKLIFDHLKTVFPQSLVLAHHNLHSLFLYGRDKDLKTYIDERKYIWVDGMAILWILRVLGYDAPRKWRLTFLDWQHSFFAKANHISARVFLLGSGKDVIEKAAKELSTRYPNVIFAHHHGYIDLKPEKNIALTKTINDFKADVLLVGMGMPMQESWIDSNQGRLNSKVIMPLGGYFDYIAGTTYTPPRISGRLGLEWLFRLAHDPKRLYSRYLVEPWFVIFKLIKNRQRITSDENSDNS